MSIEDQLYEVSALARRDSAVCRAAGNLVSDVEVLITHDLSADEMKRYLKKMLVQFQDYKNIAHKGYEDESRKSGKNKH